MKNPYRSVGELADTLDAAGYLADPALATAVFLALSLERPLFLEGQPGVGKTALAGVMSQLLNRPLVRLQCYYGIDLKSAAYDWNYARQMVHIRLAETLTPAGARPEDVERDVYSRDYLAPRPLLTALTMNPAPVLLIDEVDRADEAFEALLLEFLGEFQMTIPEVGTFRAEEIPLAVLTSNRTRDVHDALRRRCLYAWVDFPDPDRERAILARRCPALGDDLLDGVVKAVAVLRDMPLAKRPGLAESLDWAQALARLGAERLTPELVERTLGLIVKYYDDLDLLRRSDRWRLLLERMGRGGHG
ncbi:MAG: MoxR family ATPase [Firmicutes bacterium]|nr:MoxR family ATPase [Bacillota bacterium]